MKTIHRPVLVQNERPADRIVRGITGALLLVIAFSFFGTPFALFEGAIVIALIAVGALTLLSGLIGWCPVYALLGFSSCTPPAPR